MTRLLIYEPAYERVRADLAALPVEPLVLAKGGGFTLAGASIDAADAKPDIAWFSSHLYLNPDAGAFVGAVLGAPALKWVHTAAAGFDHPIFGSIVDKGARLTTSHGQAVGMADYVVAGVLDHFQRGPDRRAAQAAKEWKEFKFREVLGTTWLLIGFGAIGQGVAERARGLGAQIVGVRRSQAPDAHADRIAPMDALPKLLPEADVVVLSVPLGATTRHLAGAAFFAAMKPGSVLVNVGRGGLVDEAALLAALDRGVPAHAVLDVFEVEPLPAESPFWAHPRVSLTAHCSGVTGAQEGRNQALFLDNLKRWLAGQPLTSEMDPKDVKGG